MGFEKTAQAGLELATHPRVTLSSPYLSLTSSAVYGYITMSDSLTFPPFLSMDGIKSHTYGGQVNTFTFSAVVTFNLM